jgi:hypothetical protein
MSADVRRARLWLSLGAAAGLALAVRGVVRPARAEGAIPDDAVATVGTATISRTEHSRAVAAVQTDRRDHVADADLRRHVLDRLIEEELLVQAALERGLPSRDRRLRGQVATAMLDGVVGEAGEAPGEANLRAFHASRAASFTRRGRVRVETLFFRGDGAVPRAEVARARLLAGEPLAIVKLDADEAAIPLPVTALSIGKLGDYMGAAASTAVDGLSPGAITLPIAVDRGAWLARLVDRQDGELAPFEAVRPEVLAEWRREDDDRRLRAWLDRRRAATPVRVREALP